MNYVFISPNFPPSFKQFAIRLKEEGVTVLGVGSDPYETLEQQLKDSLTEYYKVDNMSDYEQMLKACAFLTFKHGKIDRIESHNEHWLAQDAQLREDFNVFGFKPSDTAKVKSKTKMKEVFKSVDIPVARGRIARNIEEAKELIKEIGLPIVAKPDSGVGASQTYKLEKEADLERFFREKPDVDYIMEEFIDGTIVTFDGFTDKEGNIVEISSMSYWAGLMETVNDNLDSIFCVEKIIPKDIELTGKKIVEAFGLKERFFHIEFFRLKDNSLMALEINARPPGGLCLDASNFASDSDIYKKYAITVAGRKADPVTERPYFSAFVGLKIHPEPPVHTMDDNRAELGAMVVYAAPNPPLFAASMGEYAVILRHDDFEELKKGVAFATER